MRVRIKGKNGRKIRKYQFGNVLKGLFSGQGQTEINDAISQAVGATGGIDGSAGGKMKGINIGQGITSGLNSVATLNADGNFDDVDAGQSALDAVAGSTQFGQMGKQVGQIATGLIGQDGTTQNLGEGVDYQKGGITAMNKALEYGAAGAKFAGPYGAAAGTIIGGAVGLLQGGKAKREAEKEFIKRRKERVNRFNEYSQNQYSDQFNNQAMYAKKGGEIDIKIKKENRGKFKEYCVRNGYTKVTDECIQKGKKSNSKIRKRAIFAENARNWNK